MDKLADTGNEPEPGRSITLESITKEYDVEVTRTTQARQALIRLFSGETITSREQLIERLKGQILVLEVQIGIDQEGFVGKVKR